MISDRSVDTVNMTDVYTDLAGIQSIKASAKKDQRKALQEISVQFESMMMSMMLKSMRQANDVFSEGNPLIGKTEKFYRDMFDQQLSLDLGKSGSVGIAEAMFRQLEKTLPSDKAAVNKGDAAKIEKSATFSEILKPTSVDKNTLAVVESVPVGEIFNEDKFSEIDLWLSPNPSTTVDYADAHSLKEAVARDVQFDFDGTPEKFIEQLYDQAKQAASVLGVKTEVLLAQAGLETGWGQKLIQKTDGVSSFNLFNIKAGKQWDGDYVTVPTLEYRDGIAVKEQSAFRSYRNPQESFADYVELLSNNPRYKRAIENADDPKRYVRELERAGYATDPNYAEKIIEIMNSDSLKKTLSMKTADMDFSSRG